MVYTEIKERNGKKYYYRAISLRQGSKINKKRKYLGVNLAKENLSAKENSADEKLTIISKKNRKELALKKIVPKIIKILKKNGVKKAGIFGSYARGEQNKNSDIDILIELPKGMGFAFFGLNLELEEELGKKVHLVTYKYISPYIKERALVDEVKII